jgi:phosphonate transport system substrate-binding protein
MAVQKNLKNKNGILFICFIFFLFNASCSTEDPAVFTNLEIIRVGVLPDDSKEGLVSKYIPLLDYISDKTGMAYELNIPEDYDELLKWFHEKKIDMAWFGGYSFVKAMREDNANPIVMRDIDEKFYSVIITRVEN